MPRGVVRFRFLLAQRSMAMIGTTWMKWTAAGAAVVVALATLPAVGQARVHYTGVAPASVTPVAALHSHALAHTAKKSSKLASHKKHKLSAKHHAAKKLHAKHKLTHHTLSTSKSKKA